MSDIKWIKITSYMFEDEKIRLIDAMPEGIMVIYVWIRLLVQAGKINAGGCVYLNENIPYTAEMLATLFGKPLEAIKSALKILCDFQMIEIDSNNIIEILNWEKHQNVEGMEKVRAQNRKRAADYREKKKQIKQDHEENSEEENNRVENIKTQGEQSDIKVDKNNNSDELKCLKDIVKDNNEENIEKIEEAINYNSNINEDKSCDSNLELINTDSNVTVTEQNKKEKENKIENKKKDIEKENANLKALELMHYHEKITGKVGGCDYVALRAAIEIHGEKWVKMAMEVGFERNCPDIKYAIGVLKNWRRDGYPEDLKEVKKNEFRCNGKGSSADKNEFAGFKPKEPRKLTEEERRKNEANLI